MAGAYKGEVETQYKYKNYKENLGEMIEGVQSYRNLCFKYSKSM